MKLFIKITSMILTLILIFAGTNLPVVYAAGETTYYVDAAGGSDSNNGTSRQTAFKTIQKAADTMASGDICLIETGTYRETVTVKASNVTFKADVDANVTVSGANLFNGSWTQYTNSENTSGKNIYQIAQTLPMPTNVGLPDSYLGTQPGALRNQVYVDGVAMQLARYPSYPYDPNNDSTLYVNKDNLMQAQSGGYGNMWSTSGKIVDNTHLAGSPANYWAGGAVIGLDSYGWSIAGGTITGSGDGYLDIGYNNFFDLQDCSGWYYGVGAKYYIVGARPCLMKYGVPGEWYYDGTNTYLITLGNDNPNGKTIEYKARTLGFDSTGKDNVTIQDINLFACTIEVSGNNNILDGITARYISEYYSPLKDEPDGLNVTGSNNIIRNCDLKYASGSLLSVTGDGNKVLNNVIASGYYGPDYGGSLIYVQGKNALVSNNTAYNSIGTILTGAMYNSTVQYNDFSYGSYINNDLGLFYTAYNDLGNTQFIYNDFHNGVQDFSNGIYLDLNCHNALVYGNKFYNFRWTGMYVNSSADSISVINNTFYNVTNQGKPDMYYDSGIIDAYNCYVANNIVNDGNFGGWAIDNAINNGAQYKNNMTSGDPMYVNAGANDFRLNSGSPAIGAGVQFSGIHSSSTPDQGAYQSGENWTTGANLSSPVTDIAPNRVNFINRNVLQNSAFEVARIGETDLLQNWTKYGAGNASVLFNDSKTTSIAHYEYQYGVELSGDTVGLQQTMTGLLPNTTYRARGWALLSDSTQQVKFGIKDIAGTTSKVTDNSKYGISFSSYFGRDMGNWQPVDIEFTTGANETSATFYVEKTTGGTLHVDDMSVNAIFGSTVVPTPTPAPTPGGSGNLALNMQSTASATAGGSSSSYAFDGNGSTRWASGEGYNGDQWIQVDLGSAQTIDHVTVKWETAYTSSYKIQVSNDGSSWTDVYTGTNPTGLTNPINDITFAPTSARYVRVYCFGSGQVSWYGFSIWEVEVYGATPPPTGSNLALNKTASASSEDLAAINAFDGIHGPSDSTGTRWNSAQDWNLTNPAWLQVDLGSAMDINRVVIEWHTGAYSEDYQIQVSSDGINWTNVYTATGKSNGNPDDISFSTTNARYVRVNCTNPMTGYGYSIWEFEVYGATTSSTNKALSKPASASSQDLAAINAFDGIHGPSDSTGTRWNSAQDWTLTNPAWLQVDLESAQDISRVVIEWHTGAYSEDYQIQVSGDGINWTNVYTATGKSNGNPDDISFSTTNARYVRVNCTNPMTGYGYSIWELEVY